MSNQELEKKIAHLESVNDQIYSELCYIDQLMRMVGFSNGLATVKQTAQEMKNIDQLDDGDNWQ
ncbi:MAG TPA: hypothetical protein VIH61_08650 [Waddliaceae bacterium]